jgi:hypothetical protein
MVVQFGLTRSFNSFCRLMNPKIKEYLWIKKTVSRHMVENHLTDEAMTRSFGGPAFGPAHRLVETAVGLVDTTVDRFSVQA